MGPGASGVVASLTAPRAIGFALWESLFVRERAVTNPDQDSPLESTAYLLERHQDGDERAGERLVARYLPILRRWAHGQLPADARGLSDTDDLVQMTLIKALNSMKGFEVRREGAFFAYLRRILLNTLRDEVRKAGRRPRGPEIEENVPAPGPSILEQAVGKEAIDAYEAALAQLPEQQQQGVILRVEFGFTHPQIAEALGMPSANAARMMVARALVPLAEAINAKRQG